MKRSPIVDWPIVCAWMLANLIFAHLSLPNDALCTQTNALINHPKRGNIRGIVLSPSGDDSFKSSDIIVSIDRLPSFITGFRPRACSRV